MATTTAGDIITLAQRDAGVIGVGQTSNSEDVNDAFDTMTMMMSQWNRKRWLVYHLIDVALVSTGAQSYTVGSGGDFNTTRPDRLEAAYFRQLLQSPPNQVDYPLNLIQSREEYSRITLKQLSTIPQWIFYDSAYPLGIVYPWPVLQTTIYELHLVLKDTLQAFANLTTAINLPPEYKACLRYNLAARLRPMYQLPPDPSIVALAQDSLNVIRNANVQIPRLRMPTEVVRPGLYSIYSDSNY